VTYVSEVTNLQLKIIPSFTMLPYRRGETIYCSLRVDARKDWPSISIGDTTSERSNYSDEINSITSQE
jgi:tartrate dehydratase beta subunit/fumarate hydratase class I family protein